MSVHSSQKKRRRDCNRVKFKTVGNHDEFLERITKTLYYGKLPLTERFSLPVTELAAELYSEVKSNISLDRLRPEEAAEISRNACVSPCSFVLAMLYLEQLKTCNPCYVDKVAPSELFLISLMVAAKFLNDSGEEDDILNCEWASSAGVTLNRINRLEKEFLRAINWEVYVNESAFWQTLRNIEKDIAIKEGKKRGWFTYTDLEILADCLDGLAIAQAVFMISAVCLASYTAGILTVIGSTLLATQISSSCFFKPTICMPSLSITEPFLFAPDLFINQDYNGSTNNWLSCRANQVCDIERFYLNSMENDSQLADYITSEDTDNMEMDDDNVLPSFKRKYLFPLSLYYMDSIQTISKHLDYFPLTGVMSH